MGESQPSATGASGTPIDWAAEFQLTEFLSGLQTVLAGMANSMPRPDQLEQFGDSIPSQPTTSRASAPGNLCLWLKVCLMLLFLSVLQVVVSQKQVLQYPHLNHRLVCSTPPMISPPLLLPLTSQSQSWSRESLQLGPQSCPDPT